MLHERDPTAQSAATARRLLREALEGYKIAVAHEAGNVTSQAGAEAGDRRCDHGRRSTPSLDALSPVVGGGSLDRTVVQTPRLSRNGDNEIASESAASSRGPPGAPRLRDRRLRPDRTEDAPRPRTEIRRSSSLSVEENESGEADVVLRETTRIRNRSGDGSGSLTLAQIGFPPRPSTIMVLSQPRVVSNPGHPGHPGHPASISSLVTMQSDIVSNPVPPPRLIRSPLQAASHAVPMAGMQTPARVSTGVYAPGMVRSSFSFPPPSVAIPASFQPPGPYVSFRVRIRPCRRRNSAYTSAFPPRLSSRPYKYRVSLTCSLQSLPRVIEFYLSHSAPVANYQRVLHGTSSADPHSLEYEIMTGGGVNYVFLKTSKVSDKTRTSPALFCHVFEIQFGPASAKTKMFYRLHIGERERVLDGQTPQTKEIQVREFFRSSPFLLYVRKSKAEEIFWRKAGASPRRRRRRAIRSSAEESSSSDEAPVTGRKRSRRRRSTRTRTRKGKSQEDDEKSDEEVEAEADDSSDSDYKDPDSGGEEQRRKSGPKRKRRRRN